jgi:hypothetical protein
MERASQSGLRGNILHVSLSSFHPVIHTSTKQHRLRRTRVPIEEQMRIRGRDRGYEVISSPYCLSLSAQGLAH